MDEKIGPQALKSNLDLLNDCDSFPYFQKDPALYLHYLNTYYHLRVSLYPDTTLGFILPSVALTLSELPDWTVDSKSTPFTITLTTGHDEPTYSAAVAKTTLALRETGNFEVLDKWRGESYAVYGPGGDIIFSIERSACPLFGVVTYGVHMTACTKTGKEEYQIWIPRRSATKQTYPSMLDNTAGGGITAGESPFESMVREAMEEVSLPSSLVQEKAKAAGCITYFHIRDSRAGGEIGLLIPECLYVYDLDLSGDKDKSGVDISCKPNHEEVERFELLVLEEVKRRLVRGEFKPTCALVMLDFLVRHGLIVREDEKDFVEICSRLHRVLEFPLGRASQDLG